MRAKLGIGQTVRCRSGSCYNFFELHLYSRVSDCQYSMTVEICQKYLGDMVMIMYIPTIPKEYGKDLVYFQSIMWYLVLTR